MIWVERVMGDVALASEVWDFTDSDFYAGEMGTGLKRRFFSFDLSADPALLPEWKLATNRIEQECAQRMAKQRPVNLDPGYIDGCRLVLASTKAMAHRVYIGQGISAEVTMSFRDGQWIKRDYTFADFKSGRYDNFFHMARHAHMARTQGRATG